MDLGQLAVELKPLAIAISMSVFLGLIAYVFWPRRRKAAQANARIPLRED